MPPTVNWNPGDGSLSAASLADLALDAVRATGFAGCLVLRLQADRLVPAALTVGERLVPELPAASLDAAQGALMPVLREHHPYRFEPPLADLDRSLVCLLEALGAEQALATPIAGPCGPIGLLLLHGPAGVPPIDDVLVRIVRRLGDSVAVGALAELPPPAANRHSASGLRVAAVAAELARETDRNRLIEGILRAARDSFDAVVAGLDLWDAARGGYAVNVLRGDELLRLERVLSGDEGLNGEVLRRGRAVVVDDYAEAPWALPEVLAAGLPVASSMGAAVRLDGRPAGSLVVQAARGGRRYSAEDAELLNGLAELAGALIENLDRHEREWARIKQLTALSELARVVGNALDPRTVVDAVLDGIVQLVPVERISLSLREVQGWRLLDERGPVRIGQRIMAPEMLEAVVTRQGVLYVPDLRQQSDASSRQLVAAGLLSSLRLGLGDAGDGLAGVLHLQRAAPDAFSAEEITLLQQAARHVTVALRNARLYEQREMQRLRAETLAEMSRALNGTFDADELARTVVERLPQLVPCDRGGYARCDPDSGAMLLRVRYTADRGVEVLVPEVAQVSDTVSTLVVERLASTITNDVAEVDGESDRKLIAEGYRARLVVPVVVDGRCVGLLAANSRQANVYTAEHMRVLEAVAGQLAAALRNVSLFQALERAHREASALSALGELLQACRGVNEAFVVVDQYLQQIFPELSGALYVLAEAENALETAIAWGDRERPAARFRPDDCWALRLGRPHLAETGDRRLTCAHAGLPGAVPSLCVPMLAQGKTLGILHLSGPALGGERTQVDAVTQLATRTVEIIALALANLRLQATLRHQSIRDPLTGLFNRRYLEETLARELRRAERSTTPLAVMMLDADRFKRLNDLHGHDAGDSVLATIGRLLQKHLRGGDIACRYGGEEFVLVLPETSLKHARQRAEELRGLVERQTITHRDRPLGPVTISVGVAAFPQHGLTAAALLRAADAALYAAKRAGRNRTVVAGPNPAE